MMPLLQKGAAMAAGQMPKILKPRAHAVIDYLAAGIFFTTAALYWRRNRRAAVSSLACGGITTLNSLLTDYPGGVWRVMGFQTHGKLDAGLVALTATMPRVMGFAGDPESKFFTMQSVAGTVVTAMTDFDYYEHPASDRLRREDEEQVA